MRFSTLFLPIAVVAALSACGDAKVESNAKSPSSTAASSASSTAEVPTTAAGAVQKPEVKIPATLPTALVVTDLAEGTGSAAANGDTVIVNYVGVRSADGHEFDNSYDRGVPFPVTLGLGQVIKGWDQGLVGVKTGGRRQLDIPADMAYGDAPPSTDVIKAGDALTFVVEVVIVIPGPDPANTPTISIPPTANQPTQTFVDLIVGEGAELQPGQSVALQFQAFSAATGQQIASSWEQGTPMTFVPGGAQLPPGLEKAVEGMKVGGRRQVTIPFVDAFGAAGNADLGLPASTDLIMVLDLVAVY